MGSEATIIAINGQTNTDRGAGGSAALVERARRGDVDAFEQLMRAHEERVVRTAWCLLGRREDAQDASQEVFLRLYRFLDRFEPGRDLAPWLYRVTVNVCHDLGRRRSCQPLALADHVEAAAVASTEPGPDDRAELAEERRITEAAIAALPRKERAALVLRDVEGLTTGEVADILGSSQVTVRTHICRARMKIKRFRDQRLGGSDP